MPRSKKTPNAPAPAPKTKKPPAWGSSRAKEILLEDIKAGIWKRGDPPAAIWLSRDEYQIYDKSNFGNNFRAACDQLERAQARANADAAAVFNDRQIHPRSSMTSYGYPHWDLSTASQLLLQDIEYGKLDFMTPKELRESREEFLDFPLDVFRKHIHQYRRKMVEEEYWKKYWHQQKLKKQGLRQS
jgi:hypothetical protein